MSNAKALTECMYEENMLVRMFGTKEEPWFVAIDVFNALGISKNYMARTLKRLDSDEKGVIKLMTPGGQQDAWIISEPGFYRVALSARTEKAKKFQRWVTHEVLPRIRKYGYYKLTRDEKKAQDIKGLLKEINKSLVMLDEIDDMTYYEKINNLDELKEEYRQLEHRVYEKEIELERAKALEKYPYTQEELEDFGIDVGLAIENFKFAKKDLSRYMIKIRGKEFGEDTLYSDIFVKQCLKYSAVLDEEAYRENYIKVQPS